MAWSYELARAGINRKRKARETLRNVFEFGTGIKFLDFGRQEEHESDFI
jgi:hypothetical protein